MMTACTLAKDWCLGLSLRSHTQMRKLKALVSKALVSKGAGAATASGAGAAGGPTVDKPAVDGASS